MKIHNCQGCKCEITDKDIFLDLGNQPLSENFDSDKKYPLQLVKCPFCCLIQLNYIVDNKELFKYNHPYATGNTPELRNHFLGLSNKIKDYLSETYDTKMIIDIGSNDGTLLSNLIDNDILLIGVEPTVQALQSPDKINVFNSFWTFDLAGFIAKGFGEADVVTATNVLAHVPDVHEFLQGVYRVLKDDGVFITENHDVKNVLNGQWDTVYHEHLRYYSISTLSNLLSQNGFFVDKVEHIDTHGGSFRIWAKIDSIKHIQTEADLAAKELRDFLSSNKDKKIFGVGATTRAATLLNFANIDSELLPKILELNGSDKLGHKLPGTKIKIIDEDKALKENPDLLLILSWHLKDPIIKSLRNKGYDGQFVVPLPKLGVINV